MVAGAKMMMIWEVGLAKGFEKLRSGKVHSDDCGGKNEIGNMKQAGFLCFVYQVAAAKRSVSQYSQSSQSQL